MGRGESKIKKGSPGAAGDINSSFDPNAVGFTRFETLKEAIGTRGKPMSVEKAVAGANPYHNNEYSEFSENCQRCVLATEMRMRGYKVVAQPTYEGDTAATTKFVNPNTGRVYKEYFGAFQDAKTILVSDQKDFEQRLKSYGDGARVALSFGWEGAGYGHVLNVVYKKGAIRYVDGQTGEYFKGKQLWGEIKPGTAAITRLDNLKISNRMKEYVEPEGRRK